MNRLARLLSAGGIGVGALLMWVLHDSAVASAVCLERAKYELILCAAPPDGWAIALAGVLAVASALALGASLQDHKRLGLGT
jgi:hypothetical protein